MKENTSCVYGSVDRAFVASSAMFPLVFAGLVLLSVLLLVPSSGRGQEQEVAAGGKIVFEENCMVCHGQGGKGDGIMVTFSLLNVTPPDLTLLGKRNGGHFPFWRVYGVIDGRDPLKAHGSREMPLWGDEFRLDAGSSPTAQTEVRGKILSLVYYLQSIQQK
jgi:mono/diheme cytochrome c family protein